jgi:hypothetical protein
VACGVLIVDVADQTVERLYINWSGRLTSLGDAKTVAALWAELMRQYEASREKTQNINETANGPKRIKRPTVDAG